MKTKPKVIVGIDEVGRGALAGPVTTAAVLLPRNFQSLISGLQKKIKIKLRDSKKLSSKQREKWFYRITPINAEIRFAAAKVSPKIIDRINISRAANLAANRAFRKLIKSRKLKAKSCKVFLDGGLYLPKTLNSKFHILNSIVKGDEKIPAVALASIVAKVTRDRYMKKLHKNYPRYDFINNVGYGTKKHLKAIRKYGLSPVHRKSFITH